MRTLTKEPVKIPELESMDASAIVVFIKDSDTNEKEIQEVRIKLAGESQLPINLTIEPLNKNC